ncbi:hypothetical protein INT48_006421 [Thamnidium elegans]|uniref:CNH domain-containing protein n=1 Tax=Thamnidium elegans TaxID=101142 RepID=A0A8H7VP69_9FUNG|nr:hypothetical protein INT48_006421 [Thamnidium elegans]
MQNETSFNLQQQTELDALSGPPPPYTDDYPPHPTRLPNNLNLSRLAEETLQSTNISSLQLKMIASCTDSWHSTPYECCSVLEDRFLLLGYHDGVQLIDLKNPDMKAKTIIWIRARDITVIESCRVVLILAGRYKQVRCYSYDGLLRLIYAVLGIDWNQRKNTKFQVPLLKDWEYVASLSGKVKDEEIDHLPPQQQPTTTIKNEPSFTQVNLIEQPISSLTKPYYTVNNITLQKLYYKLPDSKDALSVQTYQTSVYVFAAIRHRDKIVLWQRKRDHPLRPFYRLKVFWIPAESKCISFADDRSTLRHILVVFANEATAIELRDSKVKTVPIDPILERIYQTTWVREQYEHQLASPRSPNSPIPTLFSRQEQSDTYPMLPVSLSVPPIQWTSLIQLPFYPDILPATTLTTEYSIPPSYSTVITSLPSSAPDPVALPSASAPQLFFATLLKQSYIIDLSGSLFSTQVYKWSEVPIHIEFIQLDCNVNDWCVVGFGTETIEIIHIKSAHIVQRVMRGVPVKFLGRWDESVPREGKKNKSVFRSLIWACHANERIHVYMLKPDDVLLATLPL